MGFLFTGKKGHDRIVILKINIKKGDEKKDGDSFER
jgi:hypothetical protein